MKIRKLIYLSIIFFYLPNSGVISIMFGADVEVILRRIVFVVLLLFSFSIFTNNGKKLVVYLLPLFFFLIQPFIQFFTAQLPFSIVVNIVQILCLSVLIFIAATEIDIEKDSDLISSFCKISLVIYLSSLPIVLFIDRTFFLGNYPLYDRFGFNPIDGYFPHHNVASFFLLNISLLLFMTKGIDKWLYLAIFFIILTTSRSGISQAIFIIIVIFGRQKHWYKYLIYLGIIILFISLLDFIMPIIEATLLQLDYSNKDTIYRLGYIKNTVDAFSDYPIFGVGYNRLSINIYWELDNFFIYNKYSLTNRIVGTGADTADLATSDTSITVIAELGLIGIICFGLIFKKYLSLTRANKLWKFNLVFIPIVLGIFQISGFIFTYSNFYIFWFLYGMLIKCNFKKSLI